MGSNGTLVVLTLALSKFTGFQGPHRTGCTTAHILVKVKLLFQDLPRPINADEGKVGCIHCVGQGEKIKE